MNLGFNDNIPSPNDDASDDQPLMFENTNSIRSILEVDHIGFNNNQGGYHKTIHQPFTETPTTILNVNQFYSRKIKTNTTLSTVETQLFNATGPTIGVETISQMTGYKISQPIRIGLSAEGYQWVGGILIQWGVITNGEKKGIFGSLENTNELTFKDRAPGMIPFPNNLFTVYFTLTKNDTSEAGFSGSVFIHGADNSKKFNRESFSWFTGTATKDYNGFFWLAIGN